jgi:hypothetical protein
MRRNQISSFGEKGRVHLNRRGASVQSTTDSRGVRISGSNAGYTVFRGSVKGTGYPLHSPVSPSIPLSVRHRVPSHFNWSLRCAEGHNKSDTVLCCTVLYCTVLCRTVPYRHHRRTVAAASVSVFTRSLRFLSFG